MLEEVNSDSIPVNKTISIPKINCINLYNKLSIIISASLIVLILMISWILWLTISNDAINSYIDLFNKKINDHSSLLISFNEISVITFLICIFATVLVIIPFIFLKIKNSISALFSLITFIFALVLIITLLIFIIFRFSTFEFLFNKLNATKFNTKLNQVLVFLPWLLIVVIACFLLTNSLWLAINIASKYKSNALITPIAKPLVSNESSNTLMVDDKTLPNLTYQIASNNLPQSINVPNNLPIQEPALPTTIASSIYSVPTAADNKTISSEQSKYDELAKVSQQSFITPTISENGTANQFQSQNQGDFNKVLDSNKSTISNIQNNTVNEEASLVLPIPNTSVNYWTIEQIEAVWKKAEIIDNISEDMYRKDYSGAWIFRDAFTTNYEEANNEKTYAWTIVLHRPAQQGGNTELYNLDPMNIVNAKSKGQNYPRWITKISAKGNENILKEQTWKART